MQYGTVAPCREGWQWRRMCAFARLVYVIERSSKIVMAKHAHDVT